MPAKYADYRTDYNTGYKKGYAEQQEKKKEACNKGYEAGLLYHTSSAVDDKEPFTVALEYADTPYQDDFNKGANVARDEVAKQKEIAYKEGYDAGLKASSSTPTVPGKYSAYVYTKAYKEGFEKGFNEKQNLREAAKRDGKEAGSKAVNEGFTVPPVYSAYASEYSQYSALYTAHYKDGHNKGKADKMAGKPSKF